MLPFVSIAIVMYGITEIPSPTLEALRSQGKVWERHVGDRLRTGRVVDESITRVTLVQDRIPSVGPVLASLFLDENIVGLMIDQCAPREAYIGVRVDFSEAEHGCGFSVPVEVLSLMAQAGLYLDIDIDGWLAET